MDKRETIRLFAVIAALFPRDTAFAAAAPETVAAWQKMLADVPYREAELAVQAHASLSPFPPSIAEIRARMVNPDALGEMEAWVLVRKAMTGGRGTTRERFERLPRAVQRAVGGPSQLTDWGFSDIDSLPVIQSVFLRSYRAVTKQEAERAAIPESMRKMLASGLRLAAGKGEGKE